VICWRVVRLICFLVFILVAVVSVAGVYAQDGGQKVVSVAIRGTKRIDVTAIQGRLTMKAGDAYTGEAIRTQIRLIYEMGFYEDVRIETEPALGGVAVTFVVREKPFITEIVFDGNENIGDDKLKEKITIRNNSFLDQQQAKESAERIRSEYHDQGYYNVRVTPIVQGVEEDRKRLTFFVKEGQRARIKTVTLDGLTVFKKKELLKNLATREWVPLYGIITRLELPSMFSDAGLLKRDELANDAERIRGNYLNKGYLNAQVSQPVVELTEDKKWFLVTFTIVEGDQYTVGEVGYRGNTLFEEEELASGQKIVKGEVFQISQLFDETKRIKDLYGTKGYAFAEADYGIAKDDQAKTASIVFTIKEGDLIRIRHINISGNDKTRDNVIRREIRVNEGEVIDTVSTQRSYQRLNNLNFFETVEITPQQIEPDKVDLNVKVKEKNTGQFSIGGGYSTLDKFTTIMDISEGNFLGKGQLVRLRGQLGQQRNLGLVTFREPYFQDRLVSLQGDLYRTRTNYTTYIEEKTGASISAGHWFSEFTSGAFSPIYEDIKIIDVQAGAPFSATSQQGTQSTTGFRSSLSRDTRDYHLDPRTGTRTAINADLGTKALGGTNNFYKLQFDTAKYTPLFWDTRHMIRLRYGLVEGIAGNRIPLTELFYVGGISTMRGFVFGRAGPVTAEGSLLGAAQQVIVNNDFIFPISREAKLNGVIFFDYGKGVAENSRLELLNLRQAAGVEARWISPFGPLRVAYGFNLDPRPQERKGVFEFSVGSLF
jgi:outer membrane protein insertion porin family